MKTLSPRRSLSFLGSLLVASAPSLFASEVILQKVPPLTVDQAPAYPENLARYHLGANVEAAPLSHPIAHLLLSSNSEDRNAAEAALLCDDPTVGYALPAGKSTLLISLPKIENVNRIAFVSSGAKGNVTVATSSAKLPTDSPQWRTAFEQPLSDAVQANVGPSEAKYVRLTFNVIEPGRIASFGVYSTPQVSDFTAPRTRKLPTLDKSDSFALISYNLTDIHAKARALYVSSGSDLRQANNMIDDQTGTAYSFASEDNSPTAVIDLGKDSTLRRLSAVYAPRAGKMDFYVLKSLPGATTTSLPAPSTVRLEDSAFENMKAVGSVTDDGKGGRASVDFPATAGRYVMVRWTPAQQDASFALAEVAAFGAGHSTSLLAANTETAGGAAGEQTTDGKTLIDGKTMMDGKTMIDTKDMPAEGPVEETAPQSPAEGPPPNLPQPPPFTFVPVLVPTSP